MGWGILMIHGNNWIKLKDILIDSGPVNFIPAGGEPIVGYDTDSLDGDMSIVVNGYYKDGHYYLQTITKPEEDK